MEKEAKSPHKNVVMRCFRCHYEITPEDNGMCINEGTRQEMYICNDCHHSEFGYNIIGGLLVFK